MPERLKALTASIVSAFLKKNQVTPSDLSTLIISTFKALSDLGKNPEKSETDKPQPVTTIRASVKPNHITCLICGKKGSMLKRHLEAAHDLTPDTYRATFGLPRDYPMVAPNYAAQRSAMAVALGLGRKRGADNPTVVRVGNGRKADGDNSTHGKDVGNGKKTAGTEVGNGLTTLKPRRKATGAGKDNPTGTYVGNG